MVASSACVAITGASGALGQALLRRWYSRGARLIALSCGPRELLAQAGQTVRFEDLLFIIK